MTEEGVATCDNCGEVEHTPEELNDCLSSMIGVPLTICQMCDGHIFVCCEDCCTDGIVWSHLEDNGCDDPVPEEV